MKFLRLFAAIRYLRRICLALEAIAATDKERLAYERMVTAVRKRTGPKLAEIYTPSVAEMNELYDQDRGYTGL